ncbi:ABC transporter substrate-binding protein [Mesorhizobium sp. B2-6-5]|uniref:ABC transporter substrate-binding protein n=1 Tax=Mesorhizobium sp. B2-6-5 TaxID=2589912 RepID=UPI00112C152C|nr:ABC transporter substrate-binding protein [Mesorhizobium sp. B2-6-5]TPJ33478.1 ABC transporter substrate-binding protein [Mesorhizobium sp. B2-6-5]
MVNYVRGILGAGGASSGNALTRREFGRLLGAGTMAFGAGSLMGGVAPARSAPVRGGLLKIALLSQSTNDSFDAAKLSHPGDYIRCTSLFSYLTRLDEQGKAQPELAESFEPNDAATEWTFKLRKGVTFHDGSPLTGDDIIFSILRHKEERVASNAKQLVQNVKEVVADRPDTIVVRLVEPDADLPEMIGTFQFTIVKNGTYDFSSPVGTGAFKVKEFSPGVRTICERNENYWKNGQPYIDGFEMFSIVDHVARANALLSGDVHMVVDLRGPSIDEVAKSGVASPFITNAPRYTSIQAAVDIPPGDRQNLGLALSYLIDRERMLKTVLRGNGVISNDHPIMSGSPYYDAALPQRALDHDKAKFHLAKAGIGNSRVELHVSDASAFSVEIGQLLQREAAGVGLNLNLRREPADSYWSAVAGKRALFAATFNPRPTYNMLLNLAWKTGAAWNFSHYSNPNLDAMIDSARTTPDEAKRVEIYAGIQKTIHESGALILPSFISFVDGVSNKVQGLTPIPVGALGGFNFTDRVWLAD